MMFILFGDYITSKSDSDAHYISAKRLKELYGLPAEECVFVDNGEYSKLEGLDMAKCIFLRPRFDGDYREYLVSVLNNHLTP